MDAVGHLNAVFLFGGEHLHENDIRIAQIAVVDVIFAADKGTSLVGELRFECQWTQLLCC